MATLHLEEASSCWDIAKRLPDEIWLKIFSSLGQRELCSIATVSTGFCRLSRDPSLWRLVRICSFCSLPLHFFSHFISFLSVLTVSNAYPIPGLCILVAMSLWHEFLCQNEMDWWMDCGIFSDFVLERMVMIWENSSKISGSDTFSSACEAHLS